MIRTGICILLILLTSAVFSLTMVQPFPYVAASQTGRYYCKVIPASGNDRNAWHKARIIMCRLDVFGRENEMWRVRTAFSRNVFPSYEGTVLAVIGNRYRNNGPYKDLIVAFYRKGRLVRKYTVGQLIRRTEQIPGSRYRTNYVKRIHGFLDWTYKFILVTGDGIRYTFDAKSGRILSRK